MKISDVLRRLANNIDGHSPGGRPDPGIQNPADLIPAVRAQLTPDEPAPAGTTPAGNDREPEELFLPPLQQKQELLKKAVGVENIYDDGTPSEQAEEQPDEDELAHLKRNAGINVAVVSSLADDEPLEA